MKIRQLLEAEIKVPQTSVNEAMSVVLSAMFSRMMSILDDRDMEDYQIKLERIADRYMKKHGTFEIYNSYGHNETLSHKIQFPLRELPDRYFMNDTRKRVRVIGINVEIGDSTGAHGNVILENKILINIFLPNNKTLGDMAELPEYVPAFITQIESVVIHELMHVVQKILWNKFPDGDKLNYYDSDNNIDYDKYFLHSEEFGPLVYSILGNLKSKEEVLATQRGKEFSSEDKKELFRKLVIDGPIKREMPSNSSERGLGDFLQHLYIHDRLKWKKAVKELYGLYMRS